MGIYRLVIGTIPTFFLVAGLAIAASGVLTPAEGAPLSGALLVLVGLTIAVSLWLVGWWGGGETDG